MLLVDERSKFAWFPLILALACACAVACSSEEDDKDSESSTGGAPITTGVGGMGTPAATSGGSGGSAMSGGSGGSGAAPGNASGGATGPALTTPGQPNPGAVGTAEQTCTAMQTFEDSMCPGNTLTPEQTREFCTSDWQRYDSAGCGDAYLAFIECRSTTYDCAADWNASCNTYVDAFRTCVDTFSDQTKCDPLGARPDICSGGGIYAYSCLTLFAPFDNCVGASAGSATLHHCCF